MGRRLYFEPIFLSFRQEWDTAVLTGCWSSSGSCLQMDGLCLLPAVEVMLLADGWAAPHELRAQIGTHFSSLCFGVGIFHLCQQSEVVVVRGAALTGELCPALVPSQCSECHQPPAPLFFFRSLLGCFASRLYYGFPWLPMALHPTPNAPTTTELLFALPENNLGGEKK